MVKWNGYGGRSEVSKWTHWKKKNQKLPDNAGVYIFANSNKDVKYVGKAGARRLNVESKARARQGKDKGASLVRALITNSNEKAKSLEKYLVKKYQPPNNDRLK